MNINEDISKDVKELLSINKSQMKYDEYFYIAQLSIDKDMLVFGLGKDSNLWIKYSKSCVFVEDNQKWIDFNKSNNKDIQVLKYDYWTVCKKWEDEIHSKELMIDLKQYNKKYDLVLVDAPTGYKGNKPGRLQSIFTASKVSDEIVVHDCNRNLEDNACNVFLKDFELVKKIGIRLRHYKRNH